MANGSNNFTDLEELRLFVQERIRLAEPTVDVEAGSAIDTAVLEPLITRLGPDPYDTPLLEFILGRLQTEFPDLLIQEGDPIYDYAVNVMRILIEPLRRQIQQVSNNQSFLRPDALSDNEADRLGANFFVRRRQGGFSVGIARLYFTAPQYAIVTPSNAVFTAAGLQFYPVENQSITSDNMLFNVEGSLYYFDVIVRASEQGSEYDIPEGTLVGIEGFQAAVKVTNKAAFSEGADRETTVEFIERIENSLTEKSLVTLRGITARIQEIFESVRSIAVIGYGDVEMERDILRGSGSLETYARFMGTASSMTIALDSISVGTDFIDAGVQVGDSVTRYNIATQATWTAIISSVSESSISVAGWPPDQASSVDYSLQRDMSDALTISGIPGGILVPNTPNGEIEITSDTVHIGGALDTFVRAGFPQARDTDLLSIRDAEPLHFGLDLESFGEDDEEFINITGAISGAVRVPTTDVWGNSLANRDQILVLAKDTNLSSPSFPMYSPWYPSEDDVGRFIQFTDPDDYGTFEISEVLGLEVTGNQIVEMNLSGYTSAVPTDIGKAVTSASADGTLVAYDNTNRIWIVLPDSTSDEFQQGEAATITAGTGAGTITRDGIWENVVRVKLDLSTEYDGVGAITDLGAPAAGDAYPHTIRLRDTVSVKYRVRDRDNSRVPGGLTFGPGIDFESLGTEIGDSVVIEIGDDAGIYSVRRILSSLGSSDTLILDRELTKTLTPNGTGDYSGLRYRIADELDINLVSPRTTKIPLGNIFTGTDLNSLAGSTTISVAGGDTNFLLAGVEVDDTVEITSGDNRGTYIVTAVNSGTSLEVDEPMPTTLNSQTFKVYREFVGVARPLVRVSSIDLLDANSNPTGMSIPYGNVVDARILGLLSNRNRGSLAEGSSGQATSATAMQDTSADFVSAGVQAGDRLTVLERVDWVGNAGDYIIKTVASDTLTIYSESEGGTEFPFPFLTGMTYVVGEPSSGYVRLYFQDPTSVEVSTGMSGGRLQDENGNGFMFSEVEGSTVIPEQGSGDDYLQDMRVVRSIDVGGGDFNTLVEFTDISRPDMYDSEIVVGDTLEFRKQIAFLGDSSERLRDYLVAGDMAGLHTVAGSSKITIPQNSLVNFSSMQTSYGLVGKKIHIESGPDAGEYTIVGTNPRDLTLDQVMTNTTANFSYESSARDAQILISGSDVILEDTTDGSGLGTQVGNFITIFESQYAEIEGTYEIIAVDPPNFRVTIDAPDITNPVPAGTFSWIRTAADENIGYSYKIYEAIADEAEVLEVAPKEVDKVSVSYTGEILTGTPIVTLEDTSADFTAAGVAVGDRLEILIGLNAGVYTVSNVATSTRVEVYSSHPFSITETDVWYTIGGGLHGKRNMLLLGPSGSDSGLIEYAASNPYIVRRSALARTSSTVMADSFDGSLYYVDLAIESLGAGNGLNLDKGTRMEILSGCNIDGYTYTVANSTLTFSPYEQVSLSMSRRFLPKGNTDSPTNETEVSGRNLKVNYDTSVVAGLINDLLRSDSERPVCANPIARHFLPSYVYMTIDYGGGSSQSIVGQEIEDYINNLGPLDELEISDVEALATKRGATSITHPIEIVTLTHDIDRNLVVERSDNKVGGTEVPYNGTARISSFFAILGEGLNVERR